MFDVNVISMSGASLLMCVQMSNLTHWVRELKWELLVFMAAHSYDYLVNACQAKNEGLEEVRLDVDTKRRDVLNLRGGH